MTHYIIFLFNNYTQCILLIQKLPIFLVDGCRKAQLNNVYHTVSPLPLLASSHFGHWDINAIKKQTILPTM